MRRSAAAWTLPATLELVPEILRNSLGVVVRESQLVFLKRSALPVVLEAELLDFLDRFDALLPLLLRRELSLLMDMREGPMRNEPEYEERMNRALLRMGTGFRRLAVLMKSSVGMLQASRFRRERGGVVAALRAFQSEQEARDYLLAH